MRKLVVVILVSAGYGWAQNPPIPAAYQGLNTELQGILSGFDTRIMAQWDQSRFPTALSGELLYANGNNGVQLLTASNQANLIRELNALQAIGLSAVVVKVGFPLLYQPFLNSNGDPQDYQNFLNFYQMVAQAVHARGMRLIVENTPVYPGFYSANSGLTTLSAWYQSLSAAQYNTARATELAIVAQQIAPDFLTIDAEPDTAATLTGQTASLTPAGWAAQVTAAMSMLAATNTVPIGAGVGFWETTQGVAYVQALAAIPGLSYIDFHSYELNAPTGSNADIVQNAIDMANAAIAAGKPVAMSEAWTLKEFDNEYGTTNLTSDPTVESRDAWSFWGPLDQQFHTEFYKFANWKHLLFFSGFWSRYYWAYVDYTQTSGLTAAQLVQQSETAAATALASGQVSALGSAVRTLTPAYQVGVVSSASLSGMAVAPGEIISIFGSGLAAQPAVPQYGPLQSLGGLSVALKDSAGVVQPALLFYASPSQVNLYLPAANVANGPATMTFAGGQAALKVDVNVAPVAPGIYSANASGSGVAAAQMTLYHPDGTQTAEPLFQCVPGAACIPVAMSLGTPADQAFLTLYGTGIRGGAVTVNMGGVTVAPSFAGANPVDVGLDQINVLVPHSLTGSGVVKVSLSANGVASNTVTIQIQ